MGKSFGGKSCGKVQNETTKSGRSGKGQLTPQAKADPENGTSVADKAPCKFFGSAKGCTNDDCEFSHDNPNSVPPCNFKQRLGHCERGDVCTFRHLPWASPQQCRAHYASRDKGALELADARYKQLHRQNEAPKAGDDTPLVNRIGGERVELPVEEQVAKEMQEETYGSKAMRMMEKMGYKAGSGLGKEEKGRTTLIEPLRELERASQSLSLGFGNFDPNARGTAAERSARLANARAQKRQKVQSEVVVHRLLSDDSSSADETHEKARCVQL